MVVALPSLKQLLVRVWFLLSKALVNYFGSLKLGRSVVKQIHILNALTHYFKVIFQTKHIKKIPNPVYDC